MSKSTRDTRPNILGGISLLLFIGTLIYLTIVMGVNDRMEDDLKNEKLQSERLLSERLLEQKKRAALQTDFNTLEQKHAETDRQLINTEALLHQQQLENRKHHRELENIKETNTKHLTAWRHQWAKDSLRYQDRIAGLQQQVHDAQNALAESYAENEKYHEALDHANEMRAYGTSIESRKKKGKLTAKASRAKTIKFGMELSERLSDDLSVKIISPSGSPLAIDPSEITVQYDTVISPPTTSGSEKRKLVNIVYAPAQRLMSGAYKISVFHHDELVTKFITTLD